MLAARRATGDDGLTMIQVQLQPDIETRLRIAAQAEGMDISEFAEAILKRALSTSEVSHMALKNQEDISEWLNSLARFSNKIPSMPGETFSREWIYQDHD